MAREVMGTTGRVTGTQDKVQQLLNPVNPYGQLDPNKYFDPMAIGRFFDVSASNLGQRMADVGAQARQRAGARAYAGNYLNPGAYTESFGNQAMSPFVSALGELEGSRAQAMQGNQAALFNALLATMNARNQFGLQNQQILGQMPGWEDFMSLVFGAGGQLGSAYLGRK